MNQLNCVWANIPKSDAVELEKQLTKTARDAVPIGTFIFKTYQKSEEICQARYKWSAEETSIARDHVHSIKSFEIYSALLTEGGTDVKKFRKILDLHKFQYDGGTYNYHKAVDSIVAQAIRDNIIAASQEKLAKRWASSRAMVLMTKQDFALTQKKWRDQRDQ